MTVRSRGQTTHVEGVATHVEGVTMTRRRAHARPVMVWPKMVLTCGIVMIVAAIGLESHAVLDAIRAIDTSGSDVAATLGMHLATFVLAGFGLALILAMLWRQRDLRSNELAEMSRRLELAMEVSQIGFWDVELESDRLTWDDRACQLMGVEPRRGYFCEADWMAAVHPDDRLRTGDTANAAVDASGTFTSDYRVLRPDGGVRHLRDMATFYRDRDGTSRLIGLIWDVTADKEREEELERHRHEAEAANIAKSNFLAAMSHEIRTPLAGVIGMLDLLRDEPAPAEQAERLRIAHDSAHSLLRLLNDVLDVSKLEAGAIALKTEPTEIRRVLDDVGDLMSARALQKGLALKWSASDAVPQMLTIDALRLQQVMTNLVSNAITFTEGGNVDVALDWHDGELCGAVRDTGVGIAEADQARIFERFAQTDDSSRRRAGGTGLGLAIVHDLVAIMGGGITVQSRLDHGSTFRFTISAEASASAAKRPAPISTADDRAGGAPLRLLVADDNATNRHLIRALLKKRGHSVTLVCDGCEAVEAVRDQTFDLVLMDLQMPRMDGLEASKAIRALPGGAAIPLFALTASAVMLDAGAQADAGIDGCLGKPIDTVELFAILSDVAKRRDDAAPPPDARLAATG